MLAREHVSKQGTLEREHVSKQGTLAQEYLSLQGMQGNLVYTTASTCLFYVAGYLKRSNQTPNP